MTPPADRLLVVDDVETNRDMISRRLRREGFEVLTAASGREALATIASQFISLVLLDVEMPELSGLDVLKTVRTGHSAIELPVVMITARQQSEDVVEALSLGANDYVTKPIDFPIALARIRTQLSLRRAEAALRESEQRYALAIRGANDGVWDWDLRSGEIYFSPRWKIMLGLEEHRVIGGPAEWFDRVHPEDLPGVQAGIRAHLDGETAQFEHEYRILHTDGTYRWVLCRGLAIRDEAGRPTRMAGSQTDVTEAKVSDPLTGLPNRVLFVDRLARLIARTGRKPDALFAVLFLDVDRFKLVNDSMGHLVGDQLLVAIAERLERCLRGADVLARVSGSQTLARLGGDEFTILLEDLARDDEALRVADRIHAALTQPFVVDGHEIFASVSIGIATSTAGYDRPDAILRDADTAMYRAKALGKARSEVFDTEMRERVRSRLRLENDLRRALERDEFFLHYQPIVALDSGSIQGFEGLIRWQHSERGVVTPGEFIPTAEETGLILPIGWWVLREACRQMASWQRQLGASMPLSISVNLSARQFTQPNLIKRIEHILYETGLPASCLKLEITESTIVENIDSVIPTLLRLKAVGVQLAIDDFGTGYSSLSYLHRFPIDSLKIDQSFIRCMDVDSAEIVNAIVALAHSLGLNVIAEGVETEPQRVQLAAWGCEFGQGYLFSKPRPSHGASGLILPSEQEVLALAAERRARRTR